MSSYALRHSTLARRSPLIGFLVLMHAGFIYLVNGSLRIDLPHIADPITLVDIAPERTKPVVPIRSPAEPELAAPELTVPEPEILPIEIAADDAIATPIEPGAIADTGAPADTAVTVDPRRPIGKPPYPAQSIRLGEEGLVRISACVQPDGRLSGVELATSSGFQLLDDAAVRHLRKPFIRMKPAKRAGQAVASCTTIPIRFDIRNR